MGRPKAKTVTAGTGEPWPEDFDPEAIDHDESLILRMLEKTPAERLEVLQEFVEAVVTLRDGRKVTQ